MDIRKTTQAQEMVSKIKMILSKKSMMPIVKVKRRIQTIEERKLYPRPRKGENEKEGVCMECGLQLTVCLIS